MKSRKKILLGCLGFVVVVVGSAAIYYGPVIHDLWGIIVAAVSKTEKRAYNGTNDDNLRAIRTALMLYHESEGQFPQASGWMDAVKDRIQTNDLTLDQALRKLRNPTLRSKGPDVFGYAFNDALSAKYKGDIKDPKMLLVFDSSITRWDAHGDPKLLKPKSASDGGDSGITLDGTIVKLK